MSLVAAALSFAAVGALAAPDDDLTPPSVIVDGPEMFDPARRPTLRSSPNGRAEPDYPAGSYPTRIVIVKCVLTVEGRARNCALVKGVSAAVDQAVLDWLSESRWSPVMIEGKATQVGWIFSFHPSPPAVQPPDAGPPR